MSTGYATTHIDPVQVVESSLNRMFVLVFNNEAARQHFGFARISPFHNDAGLPGWYLWFEGNAGAYGMWITDAAVQDRTAGRPVCRAPVAARIAIAYYPDPEEKIFDTFSWFERIARVSDGFDASGTPTIEARDRLPQRYYTVGHMDLLMTAGGDLLSLACTGAEEWVDLRPAGLELTDPEGHPFQAVPPGGRDRSVPGWSLSRFLLDKMAYGLLHCQQLAVRQVSGYAFEMPAYLVRPDGTIEKAVDRPLRGYSLCLVPELPENAIDAGYDLAQNRRSWQDGLEETAYPDTRLWTEIWNGHGPEDARWGCADWWKVKNLHFHHHEGHLCACYTDR